MLCVVAPRRGGGGAGGAARSGRSAAAAIGDGHRHGPYARARGGELVGDMPVSALVGRLPAVRPASRSAPPRRCTAPPRAMLPRGAARARRCSRCWPAPTSPRAGPLFEQYDAIVQSRTVRRPEQADAAVLALPDGSALAVSIDCNGRRVAADPYTRHRRGGARVRGEPRVRRRRAARHDQQPQLRQPREAAHRLAAVGVGARPRRRRAGRCRPRSWAATCRSTTRAPPGRSTPRRWSAWSGACPTRAARGASASRARATRIALVGPVRAVAGGERAGEAARRAAAATSCAALDCRGGGRPRRRRFARRCAGRARRARTTSPRAGSRVALAECCLAGGLGARVSVGEELIEELVGARRHARVRHRAVRRGARRLRGERRSGRESRAARRRANGVRAIGRVEGSALRVRCPRRPAAGSSSCPGGARAGPRAALAALLG